MPHSSKNMVKIRSFMRQHHEKDGLYSLSSKFDAVRIRHIWAQPFWYRTNVPNPHSVKLWILTVKPKETGKAQGPVDIEYHRSLIKLTTRKLKNILFPKKAVAHGFIKLGIDAESSHLAGFIKVKLMTMSFLPLLSPQGGATGLKVYIWDLWDIKKLQRKRTTINKQA